MQAPGAPYDQVGTRDDLGPGADDGVTARHPGRDAVILRLSARGRRAQGQRDRGHHARGRPLVQHLHPLVVSTAGVLVVSTAGVLIAGGGWPSTPQAEVTAIRRPR